MRRLFLFGAGVVGAVLAVRYVWRTNPRLGTRWANETLDPFLVRYGAIAHSDDELGLIEHVGRRTGIVRRTPVHPVRTATGFRIVVPLGPKSEWAHNVIAAGRCRMQVGEVVYELDEPALVPAQEMTELPGWVRWATARMDFMYLRLHRFAEHRGGLEEPVAAEPPPTSAEPKMPAQEIEAPVLEGAASA
jgi:deazaflavin-dependent oxidoreductase (nitroreductase family)